MSVLSLSRHAAIRVQQRGVAHAKIEAIMNHADVATPNGVHSTFWPQHG